ncbi:putative ribonuclease H-like domain-containing protein [Tanacetum coccineum]
MLKSLGCDMVKSLRTMLMNEFCAKKGIKREFSVARTPQQNGVAERKNRTLIEATRTMLADSLLPIPFWAEAVNTACYVLNRVLVTKPQNKIPYELLIGKFDGKSDEGYLLGYSTSSKAFRVYNKRTKRVEENPHINFLEDQPNVAGTGPNWMFNLDFLTNSMNYIPVSIENQVIVDAGTQDSYVAGSSRKDKGPTQEYILLPLQPHRIRIQAKDVVKDAQEQPSKNASPDKGMQVSEDVFEKEGQHQMPEDEQVWQDELEMMVTQEVLANAMNDKSRQAFEEEKRRIASQKKATQATSTNQLNTVRPFVSTGRSSVSTDRSNTPNVCAPSTSIGANADESSFVYLGGKIPINVSTLSNVDLPIDPNMPDLEDASDTLLNDEIFNGAYDNDEDVGAVADFNHIDNTIVVSPITTLRIHKDHPKGQILGDHTSAVQTRGKIQKASSAQQALVWILVDLPFGKKAIGTKWVFRNKRDKRSIVVKNKARLVAQAPLPKGNTSGSVEDSVQLKELMVLVPKLVTRVNSLEKELKDTKQTLGNVVLKLVKKVKTLEIALKRKSKKVLISKSEGEESEDQGRKFQDINDDPLVSLVRESMKEKSTNFVTPTKASGEAQEEEISPIILEAAKTLSKIDTGLDAEEEINTGREEINTGIEEVSTGSTKVDSSTANERSQREGKALMVEEESVEAMNPTPLTTKSDSVANWKIF